MFFRYSSGALTNLALVRDLPKTIHPQFNYCESIPLLERAAIILLKTVGETHPNTVSTINSLRDAKNNKVREKNSFEGYSSTGYSIRVARSRAFRAIRLRLLKFRKVIS